MTGPGDNSIARELLRSFVERIERLEEEQKAINDDKRDVYAEAKGQGFDTKVMKKIIADRRKDSAERQEFQTIYDLYAYALGMADNLPEETGMIVATRARTTQTDPEAKASDDNGATVQAKGLPADSVAGDASRPSEGGGPLVSSAGEKPAPDNLNVRGDSRERPALDFPDPQAAIEKVATATNSDFPEVPTFLKRGNVVESV